MTETLTIILTVLVFLVFLSFLLGIIFRSVRQKCAKVVRARYGGKPLRRMDLHVNYLGVRSGGLGQIRGNGVLVLTEDELWFYRAAPAREYPVPLDAIRGINMPKSFLGKSIFRPLLCVEYDTGDGATDEIGFIVRDPAAWRAAIEEVLPAKV